MLKPVECLAAVEAAAEAKAAAPKRKLLILGMLAGAFIALAGLAATFVSAWTVVGSDMYGATKVLSGVVFAAGLIMVVLGGAELFTGNCLMITGVLARKITVGKMLKNWLWVYLGNFLGALLVALLAYWGGLYGGNNYAVGNALATIAENKMNIDFDRAVVLGILCNFLVCMAVWLAFAAETVQGKILAIIFPITVFIICGFEHSVANMFYIPAGCLAGEGLSMGGIIYNLLPVTFGNIIGGGVFVAIAYHFALKNDKMSLCLTKTNSPAQSQGKNLKKSSVKSKK